MIPHFLDTGKWKIIPVLGWHLEWLWGQKCLFQWAGGSEENLEFQLSIFMIPWEKAHLQVPKLCLDSIKNQQFVGDNSCLSQEQLSQCSRWALGTLLVLSMGWRDGHSIFIHPSLFSQQFAMPGSSLEQGSNTKEQSAPYKMP